MMGRARSFSLSSSIAIDFYVITDQQFAFDMLTSSFRKRSGKASPQFGWKANLLLTQIFKKRDLMLSEGNHFFETT